jgi:two-component system sensor histidine kinase KdpD
VFHSWFHVNQTTVALVLLLLILVLAALWGLRYAVIISIAATACYNLFFLPPVGTFTIADPQNWLALFAFLSTAIIASRLSQRARDEADEARSRQHELEILFRLSREFLGSSSTATLLSLIPSAAASITGARSAVLYLLEGRRLYQAGTDGISQVELPHLRELTNSLSRSTTDNEETRIPLRTGVRPTGLMLLRGVTMSRKTADAIAGLISISIDRAEALESMARTEAIKQNERLRTLMIDSITHELRTPLTSIKGAATALLAEEVEPEDSHELLTIIDEESDRLNKLVVEAIEMAQLDAQQVQMHFESVNVRNLVQSSLATCSWVEQHHPVHVTIPIDLEIRADPVFLQKVLCNLLENASKYSDSSMPITISAERKERDVAISVADRGAGIEASEQMLIFERFYRGRSQAETTSGTGMGLPISRAIVESHDGRIAVTSQPGQGSVFTVSIPASSWN